MVIPYPYASLLYPSICAKSDLTGGSYLAAQTRTPTLHYIITPMETIYNPARGPDAFKGLWSADLGPIWVPLTQQKYGSRNTHAPTHRL